MRRVTRILSGMLFGVSLICVCCEADNATSQILWSLFWMASLAFSGWMFCKTTPDENKNVDNL